MNENLDLLSAYLLWERKTKDCVDFKTTYVDMCEGDIVAGLLLSQILYWHLSGPSNQSRLRVRRDGHLWLAKGRSDWHDEIRITEWQFDRASDIMIDLGILEKKIYRFNGAPIVHVRLIQNKFLELWVANTSDVSRDDLKKWINNTDLASGKGQTLNGSDNNGAKNKEQLAAGTNPTLAGTKNITETTTETTEEKDLSLSGESVDDVSSSEENDTDGGEDMVWCTTCGDNEAAGVKDDGGRCAWCLFVDGWEHFIEKRAPRYKMVAGRRVYNTAIAGKLAKKMFARWKDEEFREHWVYALEYASRMKHLMSDDSTWFDPLWFLTNDENWLKIIGMDYKGGKYDSWEKQNHPASYASLCRWRADKQGLPQASNASVQLAGGQSEPAGEREVLFGYG